MARHTIATKADGVESFTTGRGGRPIGLFVNCDNCGCDIVRGTRNGETESELKKRLGGKRSAVRGGRLACANCGREYEVTSE